MSVTTTELAKALCAAQAEFGEIKKTKTAKVKSKSGVSYEYSYADLADIIAVVRPALSANGLAFTQRLADVDANHVGLVTELLHEGGGVLGSSVQLSTAGSPQEFGSLLTYMRRYALSALLGIATEDDTDGQPAQERAQTPRQQASAKRQPLPRPGAILRQSPPSAGDLPVDPNGDEAIVEPHQVKAIIAAARETGLTTEALGEEEATRRFGELVGPFGATAENWRTTLRAKQARLVVRAIFDAKIRSDLNSDTDIPADTRGLNDPAETPEGENQNGSHEH